MIVTKETALGAGACSFKGQNHKTQGFLYVNIEADSI